MNDAARLRQDDVAPLLERLSSARETLAAIPRDEVERVVHLSDA